MYREREEGVGGSRREKREKGRQTTAFISFLISKGHFPILLPFAYLKGSTFLPAPSFWPYK